MRQDIIPTGGELKERHNEYCVNKMIRESAVVVDIPEKSLLSLKEAMELLNCSRSTLYRLRRDCKVMEVYLGSSPRVITRSIVEYLDSQK